jgi:hypothetical protein
MGPGKITMPRRVSPFFLETAFLLGVVLALAWTIAAMRVYLLSVGITDICGPMLSTSPCSVVRIRSFLSLASCNTMS